MRYAAFYVVAVVMLLAIARAILCALRARAGVPRGRVLYVDTGGRETKALVSRRHRLKGKPDYILEVARGVVPVEVKSSRRPPGGRAHHGHVMQLAAYCLICEEHFGRRVPYGVLKYRDGAIRVPFTPELLRDLRDFLDEMRDLGRAAPRRNHSHPGRCVKCSYLDSCDQALV